ncbi:flagellar basal body rod protein FlgF [Candidatus Berkiella cookevillensis]|uniref:Flagellar basal-body rod protein FlgF n=1 Tax=Candidatus Berkiella cookevillensis TaxID=437022 RepID=A0A0Q9YGU5_9GAMM|nr:flagellar basal body rod protein FlgF [Candidatus Berkiella cookevillensis]MCS5708626.1 flagellar basal body rod protein FlgF [Candidatus Berkiella cookevillensis]
MDEMLYVTMSGAENTFYAQSVNANNLANASTTAFKADLAQFRSMPVFGDSLPSRVYALTEKAATDFSPGALIPTGRDLDMAIKGEGWFTVLNGQNKEAYMRNGSLKLDQDGKLLTENDLAVMGEGGEIFIPPAQKIEIGIDGTVSYVPLGSSTNTQVVLDRIKLVRPDIKNLEKKEDGLIYTKDNATLERDISVTLSSGFLEASNVNAVESIANMISLARQFEIQLKLMKQAEQNDEASTSILTVS